MKHTIKTRFALAMVACSLGATASGAPGGDSMPDQVDPDELIRILEEVDNALALLQTQVTTQAVSPQNFGVTPGFGMNRGTLSVGLTYTDDTQNGASDGDGSVGFGVGLGDPRNAVGLDLAASINSITDEVGQDGSLGVKVHRILPGFVAGGSSSIAVGANRVAAWGDADRVDEQFYVSGSTLLPMPSGVASMLTVGYASNNDQFTDDAFFGGLGIGWNQYFDTSVSWTGDQMTAAIGIRPIANSGLSITAGIGDVTDREDSRRALITLAWAKGSLF